MVSRACFQAEEEEEEGLPFLAVEEGVVVEEAFRIIEDKKPSVGNCDQNREDV